MRYLKRSLSVISALFVVCILLQSCIRPEKSTETTLAAETETETATEKTPRYEKSTPQNEMRAVWISFYELSMKESYDKSERAFTEKAETMLKNIASASFDTIFVHVRPNADAFYPSKIFPFTSYLSGTQGVDPGYDAFKIICDIAKRYDLSVHAWINPFRVSTNNDITKLSSDNPAVKILNDGDKSNDNCISIIDEGIYFNPTVPEAHKIIIDGVREILDNYDVDGVHIDDYFYPTKKTPIDADEYSAYTSGGGTMSLEDWRRENVSSFVSAMYSAVKSYGEDKLFTISPSANIDLNTETYYADVRRWCSESGYCDIIIPQVYYGYKNESNPFFMCARSWNDLVTDESVRIVYGLAIYKSGFDDDRAGDSGVYEWKERSDIISSEIKHIRTFDKYNGFALYSYSYAWGNNVNEMSKKEVENMMTILY
ncbi:MAG: family 10 glycosylhydrolase [Clostridiales bacterium]|nr:family 10 glycosylhydrolase [Clostridiales bacterium]